MKKALIAGAASVALAAMPVLGVFADDANNFTDNISVTIDSVCKYSQASGVGHTYSISEAIPGTLVTPTSGTATSFTVNCTNVNGYKITGNFSSLKREGDANDATTNITYSASPEASAGSKTWTAYYALNGSATPVAFTSAATGVTGSTTYTDTYVMSYKVGLDANQPAGTYTGTAQYTIAAQAGA